MKSELDVTVRSEGLIIQAVKGVSWLKIRHGEDLIAGPFHTYLIEPTGS